jgi:hypothetical protein
MKKEPRLCARPVARLICAETEKTVGYMYEWNNGDKQPAWFGPRVKNVRFLPMAEMRNEHTGTQAISRSTDQSVTGQQAKGPACSPDHCLSRKWSSIDADKLIRVWNRVPPTDSEI